MVFHIDLHLTLKIKFDKILVCLHIWNFIFTACVACKIFKKDKYSTFDFDFEFLLNCKVVMLFPQGDYARMYPQLPLRQWSAGNVYLLVLSSWKVNIAENPIAIIGL